LARDQRTSVAPGLHLHKLIEGVLSDACDRSDTLSSSVLLRAAPAGARADPTLGLRDPWTVALLSGPTTFAGMAKDLVGMAEIAQMLNVVRQYVDRLSRDDPSFPEPVATLASGRIWKRADIVRWAKTTGREIA
jgi:prophage regulatory protein